MQIDKVRFLMQYDQYYPGDIAILESTLMKRLVSLGIATPMIKKMKQFDPIIKNDIPEEKIYPDEEIIKKQKKRGRPKK